MDLHTVTGLLRPGSPAALPTAWREGDAALAGGTWLFSEPQPGLRRLVDLGGLGWDGLRATPAGLEIGATCTIAALAALDAPSDWCAAAALIRPCCEALVGSFKVWATATVGGNLCLALPAGPMTALAAALDGTCTLRAPAGEEREVEAHRFVTGNRRTVLGPGELLRRITLPAEALRRRAAFRRTSLTPLGRSAALLIGTRAADGAFVLTVTAATRRPVRLAFPGIPDAAGVARRLAEAIPDALLFDDVHGRPGWRRHVAGLLAKEIRAELEAGGPC